ncbi:hypothetical protein [Phnomibacter ginsenosidimutans]|uniref:Uncharacterized protein n=1 Tax=Phnomibacter ginsenosidimutans TaxID=2676868 RepID=A0A6I6GQV4_9BACT|nr:hypothetical protein [Phnomibacter ginsenosidimutans]QGW27429.1 hypothetical protein GLV81_04350 [Phnomibacter ginsenosidimutans]
MKVNQFLRPVGLLLLLHGFMLGFAQNIGIGKHNPIFRLDVLSAANSPARFDAAAPMYIALFENGGYVGYLGSYSGAAPDVDFGTGAGNTTGRVHLTTQATPRLTVRENGYVGINLTSPNRHLDVNGDMNVNGTFYVNANSGTTGQVLTSGGAGASPSWQTLSTAYENDIRFGVQTNQTTTGGSTSNSRTVLYNTNTVSIGTPTNGAITITEEGLYHFEGNFTVAVEYSGQTVGDNTNAIGRLVVGLSQIFDTHYITSFKKIGTGSNWRGQEVFTWEKDLYFTAAQVPVNVSYGYVFNASPTNGAVLLTRSMTGIISGYKIAD